MLKRLLKEKIQKIRFKLSANDHWLFRTYYKHFYTPKIGSLAAFLDQFSKEKGNEITVVQIGANDGITHDPIHKFIKRDHWTGVLLEPQPFVYQNYLSKIYQYDKGIKTVCAAIGQEDGKQTLYKIGFSTMRWATGLATFYKDGLEKSFQNGSISELCNKYNILLPKDKNKWITTEEITVISPKSLLSKYNIRQIDILQIDTEGYDFEVIKLFDIPNTLPEVIIYEHVHLSAEIKNTSQLYLEKMGYDISEIGGDLLCRLK